MPSIGKILEFIFVYVFTVLLKSNNVFVYTKISIHRNRVSHGVEHRTEFAECFKIEFHKWILFCYYELLFMILAYSLTTTNKHFVVLKFNLYQLISTC